MDPLRNYPQVFPAVGRHCPYGRCAVCCSQPLHVGREFAELIRRVWSPADREMLAQAARSALL
jgi:hypothetical protein